MAATIQDVARLSGVSPSTVSRAFNHSALVNGQTRERVFAVASQLDYVPNASARSLSAHRARVIGLVLPLVSGEFFSVLIRGIDEAVVEAGYELLIAGSHNAPDSARAAFRRMNGRVDGFLALPHNLSMEMLEEAVPGNTPAVFLHSAGSSASQLAIRIDNREAAATAVRHLIAEGHRGIAMVMGPESNGEALERYAGYERALEEAGIDVNPRLLFPADFTLEGGMEAAKRLLASGLRPSAVFAANDESAIGAMLVLKGAGMLIPDDMALIGFDDIPSARFQRPSLSTIHVPIRAIGRIGVESLIRAIENPGSDPPQPATIPCDLKPRASTLGCRYQEDEDWALAPLEVISDRDVNRI